MVKERRIRDKRLSTALSFFAVLLAELLFQGTMAQLVAHWMMSRYLVPFFEIVEQIG